MASRGDGSDPPPTSRFTISLRLAYRDHSRTAHHDTALRLEQHRRRVSPPARRSPLDQRRYPAAATLVSAGTASSHRTITRLITLLIACHEITSHFSCNCCSSPVRRERHTICAERIIAMAVSDLPSNQSDSSGATPPSGEIVPTHDDLRSLYSENGAVARAIMEWRHRVITLYVLMLGGVGSSVLWLHQNKAPQILPLPFCLASVVSAVLGLMDHTNSRILKACYRVGNSIERLLFSADGAIYATLHARSLSKRTITYTRVLRALYFGSSVVFLGVAVYLWEPPL